MIEADELWSFVGSKRCVQWVWVALDAESRRVVAVVTGDRSEFTAEGLRLALPPAYREGRCSTPTSCPPTAPYSRRSGTRPVGAPG